MPDIKKKITEGFDKGTSSLSPEFKEPAKKQFEQQQADYSNKVTLAFSDSLQRIFLVSASLMFAAAVLVFSIKERPLRSASPEQSPGVA